MTGWRLFLCRIRPSFQLALRSVRLQMASQPLPPTLLGLQLGRKLIPARIAMTLILRLIGGDRLRDDLPGDPVIVNVGVTARVGVQLRTVDRDHPGPHQPSLIAQP